MTPADAEHVASLLRQSRLKRSASEIALASLDALAAATLHDQAVVAEAEAEKLDPAHLSECWRVE